ncbi:MAG: carbamoyltransferase HypF [Gammaproteobacteria bacterium]|nr:carbamoyltransferase HypF [Gammaproteobacteria bacterium]
MTTPDPVISTQIIAYELHVTGQVQGVGFRPFVHQLATTHGIAGWIQNQKGNVIIHAQGHTDVLDIFFHQLKYHAPAISEVVIQHKNRVSNIDVLKFEIQDSPTDQAGLENHIHIPIDYPICKDCLRELKDPEDRRFRYPFINCTQCGPRYTIIQKLPYDRQNTSMADFSLCPDCNNEYLDPANRRFHAEPVACPVCGPQLHYVDNSKQVDDTQSALTETITALHAGKIIALKGIGGYHLICDASNDLVVSTLRQRKHRPDKPFAIMFPLQGQDGLDGIRKHVEIDSQSEALLTGPIHPVVLLPIYNYGQLSKQLAPGLDHLGVFLPYSPLHQLIVNDFNGAIVATSANISGEPVITDNDEAEQRLSSIADAFLHHDRPIVRPADDSVYQLVNQQPQVLRLGRGISPIEMTLPVTLDKPVLAVGGHMKNTIALAWDNRMVLSPHIGELDSPKSLATFEQVITDLQQLYEIEPELIVCDAHPNYRSHRWAKATGKPVHEVFHHHAHASAIVLEHAETIATKKQTKLPWLVFTWDGLGYGEDSTLWGGETLFGQPGQWQRIASFKPFNLPGGDKASRQPWRSAAALCWHTGHRYVPDKVISDKELTLTRQAWEQQINCPQTTSVGRLFDAATAFTGLTENCSYEGQAAMMLQSQCDELELTKPMPLNKNSENILEADWSYLVPLLQNTTLTISQRATLFHSTLAATLINKVERLYVQYGPFNIGLGGGVFQNKKLTEFIMAQLQQQGYEVYINHKIPCNDGGLSAGQIIEAATITKYL